MTDKPLRQIFGDAARVPPSTLKPTFNQAADPIGDKAARLIEIAERHFEKHSKSWIADRYAQLLKKDSPAPALKPEGSRSDRKAHLLRTANHLANLKQQSRISKIKSIEEQMRRGCYQGIGR